VNVTPIFYCVCECHPHNRELFDCHPPKFATNRNVTPLNPIFLLNLFPQFGGGRNRSAKPDVLHSCAKSPAQTRTLAKRDSMCHELFHPTCSTLSAMPLTKVDDAERKRQGSAASPPERGRRSERAPRSEARNAEHTREERAPSTPSSADAAGQALSKKARAAHPSPRSFGCCFDIGTGAHSAAR